MFLKNYKKFIETTRKCSAPLPLTEDLVKILIKEFDVNKKFNPELMYFLEQRIVPGVHPTSYVKANFLNQVINKPYNYNIDPVKAVDILGTMQGGYNIKPLIECLDNPNENIRNSAVKGLSNTILMFDSFYDIVNKADKGNKEAEIILKSWANKKWLFNRPNLDKSINLTSFVVNGEINTDDFSPAQDASTRDDIPLHAAAMFKHSWDNDKSVEDTIYSLKERGDQLAFVGNIIGTGSSRKSAANSLLWHIGTKQNYIPNKKFGGFCFGEKIAPIFYNTLQDCGTFALENIDVREIKNGDDLVLLPYDGVIKNNTTGNALTFEVPNSIYFEQIRSGGRINHIIGTNLSNKAREALGINSTTIVPKTAKNTQYTLAQKIIGKAAGLPGVLPGSSHMVNVTTVGSQDTTGPMTRSELQDLACLGFNAPFVLQSFCHTAAYPKPVDIVNHTTLPEFINSRGGVSLKPKDGIIHSWLNRTLLPDTVGTGGDSHTRFPIGISFPAGSGLVAFAAATGSMPLDVPESVLIKFKGNFRPGITLRDAVHYIPLKAKQLGLLTLDKKGKKNIFNGKIIEIEGLEYLYPEHAFEMSDATAERSAAGCIMKLSVESVSAYLNDNIKLLNKMIKDDYQDTRTLQRRITEMEKWLENPVLLEADENAKYAETIIIDLDEIKEPVLCCPNDPDDAKFISEVAGSQIDEVFIGSCMTNVNHFIEASNLLKHHDSNEKSSKLWIAPPTKMDEKKLIDDGYYENFEKFGANLEIPGCSLCMGNQARVADNAHVVSTSTRNFPNRLGKGAHVYLSSAKVAAITAKLGQIPTYEKYMELFNKN